MERCTLPSTDSVFVTFVGGADPYTNHPADWEPEYLIDLDTGQIAEATTKTITTFTW